VISKGINNLNSRGSISGLCDTDEDMVCTLKWRDVRLKTRSSSGLLENLKTTIIDCSVPVQLKKVSDPKATRLGNRQMISFKPSRRS